MSLFLLVSLCLCFFMCLCLYQMSLCLSVSLFLCLCLSSISFCLSFGVSLWECVSLSLYVSLFFSLPVSIFLLCLSLSLCMILSVSPSCLSFSVYHQSLFSLSISFSLSVSSSPLTHFSASLPVSISLCIFVLCASFSVSLFFVSFCLSSLSLSHIPVSLFSQNFYLCPHHSWSLILSFSLSLVFSGLCVSPAATSFRLHLPCLSLTSGEEVGRHNLLLHNKGTLSLV